MMIMKKALIALALLIGVSVAIAQTVTTETYTNAFGQVFSVVTGVVGTGSVSTVPSADRVVFGTAAPTVAPEQFGQIAVDAGDAAYVAVSLDAAGWRAIPTVTVRTSTNLVATTVTPASAGAILVVPNKVVVGSSTGTVAIAKGTSTNDWVLIGIDP